MKISVDYINRLAILDNNSLNKLKHFVYDYSSRLQMLRENDDFFLDTWYIFNETVQLELTGNIDYRIKPEKNLQNCIKNHVKVLYKVDELGILNSIYDTFHDKAALKVLLTIIDTLIEDRKLVKNNMEKFMDLGIKSFDFQPYRNIDGTFQSDMSIREKDKNIYAIDGAYSDGVKNIRKGYSNTYYIEVKNAKYVIEYFKRVDGYNEIVVKVNNLRFNTATLPSKEELYDVNIIPTYFASMKMSNENALKKHMTMTDDLIQECHKLRTMLNTYIDNCPDGELSFDNMVTIYGVRNDISEFLQILEPLDKEYKKGKSKTLGRVKKDETRK